MRSWAQHRHAAFLDPEAAERGRLLSAQVIMDDPDARKRVEAEFGVEFCRAQYPEAYKTGFTKLLDRVRLLTPW